MYYYEQIEEYLNGALSEGERLAFENAMEQDSALKKAVENHGAAMDVLGSILESEVRKVIGEEELMIDNGVEREIESGKLKLESGGKVVGDMSGGKEVKVRRMDWMRWAGAAVVVFVMGWWGMSQFGGGNNISKLYAATYSDATWPIEKGQNSNELSRSIAKYFNSAEDEAKVELKAYSTTEADYWLSELYYKEMKFDSSLLFLPRDQSDLGKNRRDRINYLEILSLYFSDNEEGAKKAYFNLPDDTDAYYDQFYSKLDF